MKADLHTHSNFSDGSDDVGRLISIAKEKGLDAIAVTDHDTLFHLAEISSSTGILVVGGVEISAIHHKTRTKAHILGYSIKKPETVMSLTQPLLESRNENSERQAEILIRLGYKIDMSRIKRAGGKYLYKQHIMDWLVSTGQAPDLFGDFYKKTFRGGGVCDFEIEYIDVFDAVKTIKKAGGLSVLAHPGQQQNFKLIPELVKAGLDGIELNHQANSEKDRGKIQGYANRYDLFLTGGSDYHGKYERYPVGIGDFLSEDSGNIAIFKTKN